MASAPLCCSKEIVDNGESTAVVDDSGGGVEAAVDDVSSEGIISRDGEKDGKVIDC